MRTLKGPGYEICSFLALLSLCQFGNTLGSAFLLAWPQDWCCRSSRLLDTGVDELGEARNLLFQDQHRAMSDQAEVEKELLDANMSLMAPETAMKQPRKKRKIGGGGGFGGGSTNGSREKSVASRKVPLSENVRRICAEIQSNGVALVPNVLQRSTAEALRETVLREIDLMRDDTRKNPSISKDYFYVPAEIHFSSPRGYVLLPLRDSESVAAGPSHVGTLVKATRELLEPKSVLSTLFAETCGSSIHPDPELYDFCVLRTEEGAARQLVHSDTPFQETPGLFCAFIALQDVTFGMGGTMFIPGTHVQSSERIQFDKDGKQREAMFASCKSQYALLRQGDAVFFDMRVLHAGLANQIGPTRLIMAVTFRNLSAVEALGHRPNLRPAYASKFSLSSFQEELCSENPFVGVGNGLHVV